MTRLRLYPVEKLVLAFALLALGLYPAIGIPLRKPLSLYLERLTEGFLFYAVGLLIAALLFRLARRGFIEAYLKPSRLLHDARLMNAFALMFVVFIQLKHLIPHLNSRLWDTFFLETERRVLGGKLAAEWLRLVIPPSAAPFVSDAYMFFYPFMAIILIYSVLQRDAALAQRFAFSFALVWFAGILLVYALPTWGPCFFVPDFNAGLPETGVSGVQRQLLQHKLFVERNPASPEGVWLISGFPSLHLAVPVLAAFAFLPRHLLAGTLAAITAVLTFVSTLYFGWHYTADDLGAVILAAFCWRAGRENCK